MGSRGLLRPRSGVASEDDDRLLLSADDTHEAEGGLFPIDMLRNCKEMRGGPRRACLGSSRTEKFLMDRHGVVYPIARLMLAG